MHAPEPAALNNVRVRTVAGYVLGEVLGEGTFGKVRVAEKNGIRYAVKILDRALIDKNDWAGKVRREVAIMRALQHPSIVRLHQVIRSPTRVYLVMELVAGGELFWKVQDEGALPESLARLYFQQLVDGISYCHSKGVYHRDLKPENLLLADNGRTLKVTDFGLSAVNPHPSASLLLRTACGSPHYCAPEVRGRREQNGYCGEKIDAWSCGVILFLLCTGSLPFHHDEPAKLQAQIDSAYVQYPLNMSKGAKEICVMLLEKDASKRASLEQIKTHTWFKTHYQPYVPRGTPAKCSSASKTHTSLRVQRAQDEACTPIAKRQSLPLMHTVKRTPRRRLKSTALESDRKKAEVCSDVRGKAESVMHQENNNPQCSTTTTKTTTTTSTVVSSSSDGLQLLRAPSLVVGDAPSSPRSIFDAGALAASSSICSSKCSCSEEAKHMGDGLKTKEDANKRRRALSLRVLAETVRDYRMATDAERIKSSSQRFRTFGARMLSNLSSRNWARTRA